MSENSAANSGKTSKRSRTKRDVRSSDGLGRSERLIRFLTENKVLHYKDSEFEIQMSPLAFVKEEVQTLKAPETEEERMKRLEKELNEDLFYSAN